MYELFLILIYNYENRLLHLPDKTYNEDYAMYTYFPTITNTMSIF